MIKLSFKMNPDSYWYGYKYKKKKGRKISSAVFISLGLIAVFIVASVLVGFDISLMICGLISLLFPLLAVSAEKRSVINSFCASPTLNGEHTLRLYNQGIEVFNAYEKVYAPWQSIFAVQDSARYLTLLLCYRKGIYVIDKQSADTSALDEIIKALKANKVTEV